MSAYFQMGDRTENLIGETDLNEFTGIVLSPINRKPSELPQDIAGFHDGDAHSIAYDIVFDPQLYVPRSSRGHLAEYSYFPSDFDTADISSLSWWESLSTDLVNFAQPLGVNAIASPAILPNSWSEDYYANCVHSYNVMADGLQGTGIRSLLTLFVGFGEMANRDTVLSTASHVSSANPDGYYLVINSDIDPGKELVGEYQLAGIMELIHALEMTGKPVIVSHCDAEMILYKAAGASHCATGKHFSLRRFAKKRYEPSSDGPRPKAYWFEQGFLGYLQEADIVRLQTRGLGHLLGCEHSSNHWSNKILDHITQPDHKTWLKFGWCQYLSWFGKTQQALSLSGSSPLDAVESMLLSAEENWTQVHSEKVYMDDPTNDGNWVRNWLQVLSEYSRRQGEANPS